ncbi:MAG: pitrilysin family protein [Rhodoferax sp.]|uniref:M16 family metallopeptidase n=1 Tax=Rhodoferax sp. TaxID=50421 RepID=UPI00262BF8D4|nr:pitrilysin family protein [Rhodoferax sp.]MDD5333937.1 pitrilysin family protein [Rhodoferax sp.]
MRLKLLFPLVFILGLQALTVVAGPTAAPLREVEGVSEFRLGNGLQVLLIPDASKPTVTVNVTYRVGSRMEGYGETGMAHLLEHLMFKTSKLHANVGAELSKRGMQFNGSTNADRTNYFETFPADPTQLSWALRTEADRMTGAKVLRKDLDSEMTVVRNEMEEGENNPVSILVQRTQAAAYQWHNYGRDTIGARSDVENVDIPSLQAFYRKYYQPDNATLIVAGAFDAGKTLQEIKATFGRLPRPTRRIAPTYTLEPVQEGERLVTLRRTGGEQAVFASYHIPALASRDYAAFEIAVTALTDAPSGRLHKRLVETGKATQVFGWASRNAEPGLLNLGVQLKKDDSVEEAQRILVETVEGLASEPVTAEELKRAQVQWAKELDRTLADPQALCVTLSESIAAGDWRLLFSLRDRVQGITLEEVNATVGAWLLPSNRTLGRFFASATPQRTPLAPRVDAAVALKDFKPGAAVAAGEAFDASEANIDKRTERYQLPSGLRVALLPKKSRGETVQVELKLHFGNVASLRGQRTAAATVGSMLGLGTQKKTRAQISDAFDALKTDWHVQSDALSGAVAGLNSKRAQLVPALTLLAELLREPAFPASEFEQLVRQNIGGLEHALEDPGALAGVALSRLLASAYAEDDPRHVATLAQDIAALKALKREAVVDFYQTQWGAQYGELVIVGDFDAAQLKPVIAQLFGDWKSGQPYARVPQPVAAAAGQRLLTLLKDKSGATAVGALDLALSDDHPDYAALRLAVHVLGASGFDSRLLTRLRQKDGMSYGAGAGLHASSFEPAARVDFYAIFAPENRARIEQGFAEELQRFVKDGITPAELDSAKKAMRAASNTWRASDSSVAWAWAGHLERQRSFRWNAELEARTQALSLEQVNAAIRKWLAPERVNWSLAGAFDQAASGSKAD